LPKRKRQRRARSSQKKRKASSSSSSSNSSSSSSNSSDIRGVSRLKRNVKRKLKRMEVDLAIVQDAQTFMQGSTSSSSSDVAAPAQVQEAIQKAPWNVMKYPMPPPPKAWANINPPPAPVIVRHPPPPRLQR
jgi:hypothetical protein